jgi:hypothetical protein
MSMKAGTGSNMNKPKVQECVTSARETFRHRVVRYKFSINCQHDRNDYTIMLARPFRLARMHAFYVEVA